MQDNLSKNIDEHKKLLQGPHFLFSAENPKFPEKNELTMNHDQVLSHLKSAGYNAHSVNGHYGAPEKSIIVYGTSQKHQNELHGLASRLGQDSSISSTGTNHEMRFHHGADAGKKVLGTGTEHHTQKPADMFTTLPGGTHHFTHNFNFGKSEKTESPRLGLVHYSHKEGLKTIDPKFKGSGVDAQTKGRDSEHPQAFFYRQGSEPEHIVAQSSAHKYHSSIDTQTHPLYDIGEDKSQFISAARKRNGGALNMDHVHEQIKSSGHKGWHNSKHPSLSHAVALYEPLPVEHHEKIR